MLSFNTFYNPTSTEEAYNQHNTDNIFNIFKQIVLDKKTLKKLYIFQVISRNILIHE